MKSKITDFLNEFLNPALLLVLSLKLIVCGFTLADCFASLILLFFVNAYKVVGYLYPARPDVHTDLINLNLKVQDLVKKSEDLERDVTGLQFTKGLR